MIIFESFEVLIKIFKIFKIDFQEFICALTNHINHHINHSISIYFDIHIK